MKLFPKILLDNASSYCDISMISQQKVLQIKKNRKIICKTNN